MSSGDRAAPCRVRVAGDLFHGRVPDGAVYVGRQAPGLPRSPYANPHPVGKPCRPCGGAVHDRAGSVAAYATDDDLIRGASVDLAGRDLACWCPLTDTTGAPVSCHGGVLLAAANPELLHARLAEIEHDHAESPPLRAEARHWAREGGLYPTGLSRAGVRAALLAQIRARGDAHREVGAPDDLDALRAQLDHDRAHQSIGSVIGRLHLPPDSDTDTTVMVADRAPQHPITIVFTPDQRDTITAATGRHVEVSGLLTRDHRGRASSVTMKALDVLPAADQAPSLTRLVGLDPDLTGGMDAADYLDHIRGAGR